jgi:hypothetical protein
MTIGGTPQVEEISARGVEPVIIPDPGDAGTIDVSHWGYCELTTGGAETRTLPDPVYRGQEITFVFLFDGGNCVITADSPINQAGNTILTFTDVGESVTLMGHWNATDGWEWVAVSLLNGVTPS